MRKFQLMQLFFGLAIITVIFGTVYTVGQQMLRSDANDPQIQMSEDMAAKLNGGASPQSLVTGKVDVSKSLAAFVQVYDSGGALVAGNAYIGDSQPIVPTGVLTASNGVPYNLVTWQPQAGVRIASVEVKANNFYVLAGRNLLEVEKREDHSMLLSALGWLAASGIFAALWVARLLCLRPKKTA
ncbi:MAG TPA: hypothetical protein VNG90_03965 [Candidatus Acidoferrum sp.]|nr:hypothetical protein [Candidatus Acidoferrum sp.]